MNDSIHKIVGELGGKEEAAKLCAVSIDAIKKWNQNGIPPKHWSAIVKRSSGKISYERLARVNAAGRPTMRRAG